MNFWVFVVLIAWLLVRTRPSFPHSLSLPSGSFHKPLILIHQRADRMKTIITENKTIWSHGPQPWLTQWSYQSYHVGPPKTDGPWWRVLTKCGPLKKGMANHFSILALRTPWTVWKGKKTGHWERWTPQISRWRREITPERMKSQSQSENSARLWMWQVMEARSDAVKSNIA